MVKDHESNILTVNAKKYCSGLERFFKKSPNKKNTQQSKQPDQLSTVQAWNKCYTTTTLNFIQPQFTDQENKERWKLESSKKSCFFSFLVN